MPRTKSALLTRVNILNYNVLKFVVTFTISIALHTSGLPLAFNPLFNAIKSRNKGKGNVLVANAGMGTRLISEAAAHS